MLSYIENQRTRSNFLQ